MKLVPDRDVALYAERVVILDPANLERILELGPTAFVITVLTRRGRPGSPRYFERFRLVASGAREPLEPLPSGSIFVLQIGPWEGEENPGYAMVVAMARWRWRGAEDAVAYSLRSSTLNREGCGIFGSVMLLDDPDLPPLVARALAVP